MVDTEKCGGFKVQYLLNYITEQQILMYNKNQLT